MTVQTFRKLPNEIKAVQFTGDNLSEIWDAFGPKGIEGPTSTTDWLTLTTTHGDPAPARVGDWVVPDSQPNTFYPIKPDVFDDTYMAVDQAAPSERLDISWPRLLPDGAPITKANLKAAWSEFMVPLQEAGRGNELNIRTLMAVFRTVYNEMPDDLE